MDFAMEILLLLSLNASDFSEPENSRSVVRLVLFSRDYERPFNFLGSVFHLNICATTVIEQENSYSSMI
jgi:hypothetical protein